MIPLTPLQVFLVEWALRASAVLALGLLIGWLSRRRSAAERHAVWAAVMVALLLLPAFLALGPKFALPLGWPWSGERADAAPAAAPAGGVVESAPAATIDGAARTTAPSGLTSGQLGDGVLLAALALGAMATSFRAAAAGFSLRGIRRRASRWAGNDWLMAEVGGGETPVLRSAEIDVPLLMGWRRPVILLPEAASGWEEDRLRMVLTHELAHLRRGDHWWQAVAVAVRALYWWHPGARLVLARLRREREAACDDAVVSVMGRPADYAAVLVATARERRRVPVDAAALAMAASPRIEGRLRAILDVGLARRPVSRRLAGGMGVVTMGCVVALAGFTLRAENGDALSPTGAVENPGLPAGNSPEEFVSVETKWIEMDEASYRADPAGFDRAIATGDLARIGGRKGVDMLSSPRVTVRPGQRASVEIGREFRYPVDYRRDKDGQLEPSEFATTKLGVILEITPRLDGRRIQLHGQATERGFDGFVTGEGGINQAVFSSRETRIFQVLEEGKASGFWIPRRSETASSAADRRRALVFRATREPLVAPTKPIEPMQVEIDARFVEVPAVDYAASSSEFDQAVERADFDWLRGRKGVDVLSAPKVIATPGAQAIVTVGMSDPAAAATLPLGNQELKATFEATLVAQEIQLKVDVEAMKTALGATNEAAAGIRRVKTAVVLKLPNGGRTGLWIYGQSGGGAGAHDVRGALMVTVRAFPNPTARSATATPTPKIN